MPVKGSCKICECLLGNRHPHEGNMDSRKILSRHDCYGTACDGIMNIVTTVDFGARKNKEKISLHHAV